MKKNTTYKSALWAFIFILCPVLSEAQLSLNAENMGLGGGGTAYLTGYESLFVNPANLYIQEKPYRFQLSILQGSVYSDPLLPVTNSDKSNQIRTVHSLFSSSKIPDPLTGSNRELLLERNYPGNRLTAHNTSQSSMYWFGIKWTKSDRNYALALRTRIGNRHEISKGQFSSDLISDNGSTFFDQSFGHQYQVLHEFSFGYAESFTFLNGLIPQTSEFIIGIAPKIILAGAYLDADFINSFEQRENSSLWIHENSAEQQTTGPLTENARSFFDDTNGDPLSNQHADFSDLLNPTGYGLGLDLGITYLISLGDDVSTLQGQNAPTEKSLRLSFSITDIGAVRYFDEPLTYESNSFVRETETTDPISEYPFLGSPNEHYFFLNQQNTFIRSPQMSSNNDDFYTMLPTSLQAGALFQMNRLKIMGDLSLSFSDTAFQNNGFTSYFGAEIRPLSFLPLRAGTRFAPGLPGYYSFGTGINTKKVDFNVAIQLKTDNITATSEIVGASVMGLKLYF